MTAQKQDITGKEARTFRISELIRKFQEQTKLSLQDIADVFRAASYDANAIDFGKNAYLQLGSSH
jgi:hypothetical protein